MLEHLRDRLLIFTHRAEYQKLHNLARFYLYLLVVWGFYRLLFRLPVWVEELWLKPLIFLVPIIVRLKEETGSWGAKLKSLGISFHNSFAAIAFGLFLGVFYLFVGRLGHFFRFGTGSLDPSLPTPALTVGLALSTAIVEELTFMGFILPRLEQTIKDEWVSATVTALLFGLIHVPILVFGYHLSGSAILGQFLLTFILGFGNSVLMLRLKNILAPILSHTLWGLAVLLFR